MEKNETEQKQTSSNRRSLLIWGGIFLAVFLVCIVLGWKYRFLQKEWGQSPASDHVQKQTELLFESLKSDTTRLKSEVTALRDQMRHVEQKPASMSNPSFPLFLAFMDLKMAISNGKPYQKELDRFKKMTPENTAPLDDYAELGIPTFRFLVDQFKAIIEELPNQSGKQTAPSFWGKIKAKLGALITIEKIGTDHPMTSDIWGLSPLYLQLKKGDIASVLTSLNQKKLPENQNLQTWKTHAEAYVRVENKLDELMQNLLVNKQQ